MDEEDRKDIIKKINTSGDDGEDNEDINADNQDDSIDDSGDFGDFGDDTGGGMPDELDLTFLTGSIPLYENDDWQMVYAEYLSNDDNVLKVYVYTFGEDGEDEYDTIHEDDIDYETLETLVTELSEKLQHKRDTRI